LRHPEEFLKHTERFWTTQKSFEAHRRVFEAYRKVLRNTEKFGIFLFETDAKSEYFGTSVGHGE
jgi:hypothetical protein